MDESTTKDRSLQDVAADGLQAVSKFLAGVRYRRRRQDLREVREVLARAALALAKSQTATR